jgi:hypothetical protein
MRRLEREVELDAQQSRKEVGERIHDNKGKTLFRCTVRRLPQNFDGHRCLTNIKVGDILNVLEEGVGPGNQYNLCSIDRGLRGDSGSESVDGGVVSVGWFPCSCLEVVKD